MGVAGLVDSRVVEVYSRLGAQESFGSGYAVGGGLVLTAGHVLVADGVCEVRPFGSAEWMPAAVVPVAELWSAEPFPDVALLRVTDESLLGLERVAWGRLARGRRTPCRALGFPLAQARDQVRDTEEIVGELVPLSAAKGGLLTVQIAGSVPIREGSKGSPWEGMSGAAVFAADLLVGVVVVDPAHFGTDRLAAVPVVTLAAEPGFRSTIGLEEVGVLAVEDEPARALLDPPYEPLPAKASAEFLRASPIHLLYPRYGIVPFYGRSGELSELEHWLDGDGDGVSVALLLGRGGSGKTRLAAQLAQQQLQAGWVAGFLKTGVDLLALVGAVSPLLIVVDEAHTRLDVLAELLRLLIEVERASPTRVLLVARERGEWWEQALQERLGDSLEAELLIKGAWQRELGTLGDDVSGRAEAFAEAVSAFARRTDHSDSGVSPPDLRNAPYERVLFIHLAALTALEGRLPDAGERIASELLAARLGQEARYWKATAHQNGLDELDQRVHARCVAVATLSTAQNEGEASSALLAVPDLADSSDGLRRRVARWLSTLYPGEGYLRPLEPDILADAHVARVLVEIPELAEVMLAGANPAQSKHALTVLTRAARTELTARTALSSALARQLPTLWLAALEVAQETGDPIGSLLANQLATNPQPAIAEQILTQLPNRTVALRELAAVVLSQAFEAAIAQPASLERDRRAGALLNSLAIRLADLGQSEQALEANQRAVAIARSLAEQQPELLPDLAKAMNNLSNRLSELGLGERALEASEEAVRLSRLLAEAQPDRFQSDLALALNNVSTVLDGLGQKDRALAASEESVDLFRRLADARPDDFRPNLAMGLTNLSAVLDALGQPERALTASEEAVSVYQQLAEVRSDAYVPDLARALSNLSTVLNNLGEWERSREASEDATALYRPLAEARPDAFLADLAGALNNFSNALDNLGQAERALEASEEAVAIWRQLADERPDAFLPELALALNNLSGVLANLGEPRRALEVNEEAVDFYRQLAKARPDAFRPDLAMGLSNLSNVLSQLSQQDRALKTNEEAAGLYRELAKAQPDVFLPTLATTLVNRAGVLVKLGEPERALEAVEEAVEIRRELASARPEAFLPGLARSLNNLSAVLGGLERWDAALAASEEVVRLFRPLAEARPAAFLGDLAGGLTNLSNALDEVGQPERALEASAEAVEIYRRLAAERPAALLPDLAGALNNLASVLGHLARLPQTLEVLEEALEIYRRLADTLPDVFLPDLTRVLANLSIVLAALGQQDRALEANEEAARLRNVLVGGSSGA
jgi:tetratricopeptide (TPR) repeat protein